MHELLGVLGLLSANQIISSLTGLVRTKILAVFIGAEGIGVFAQAKYLLELINQISTLGLSGGYVNIIAEHARDNEPKRVRETISTAAIFFGLISLLIMILINIYSRAISIWFFNSSDYEFVIRIISVAAFLYVEYSLILSTLQGLMKWKDYSRIVISFYLFSVPIIAILTYKLGLLGAIISILISHFIGLIAAWKIYSKGVVIDERPALISKLSQQSLERIIGYFGSLTVYVLIASLAPLIIRRILIMRLGLSANGIFEVSWSISILYMGLLNSVLNNHGMPKVTSVKENKDAVLKVQNDGLKLGLLVITPSIVFLYLFRAYWIPVLYSVEFLLAGSILVWQFLGDLFRVFRISLNITLIPFKKMRYLVFQETLFWCLWALMFIVFLPYFQIMAITFSYCLSNMLVLVFNYYFQLRMGFRLTTENSELIIKALSFLIIVGLVSYLADTFWSNLGLGVISGLVYYLVLLSENDRGQAWKFLKQKIIK